jgi:membrane-bound metal-dependent hydrolase YbcI (DUF457 family)
MEGTTHAATGILAGAGAGVLLHAGLPHDALYGVLAGGLALLPDADHPKASFAYAAGPVSKGTAHLVTWLFGGHRQGMHSIPVTLTWVLATEVLAVWVPTRAGMGFIAFFLAFCVAAGLRATGITRHASVALVAGCGIAGAAMWFDPGALWWLFALGMGLHIAEDETTGHGCALWWPFSRRRVGGHHDTGRNRRDAPARRQAPRRAPAQGKGTDDERAGRRAARTAGGDRDGRAGGEAAPRRGGGVPGEVDV